MEDEKIGQKDKTYLNYSTQDGKNLKIFLQIK